MRGLESALDGPPGGKSALDAGAHSCHDVARDVRVGHSLLRCAHASENGAHPSMPATPLGLERCSPAPKSVPGQIAGQKRTFMKTCPFVFPVGTSFALAISLACAAPGRAQEVIAWGNGLQGQTNVPPSATNRNVNVVLNTRTSLLFSLGCPVRDLRPAVPRAVSGAGTAGRGTGGCLSEGETSRTGAADGDGAGVGIGSPRAS